MSVSKSYRHIYGGTAYDIEVKADRFASLFGMSAQALAHAPHDGSKIGDRFFLDDGRRLEVIGRVTTGPRGGKHYITTYVVYPS